jgi:hypothetical protein
MAEETVRFDGRFALWSYTIGHGRLLLRRTKSAEHPTRVDILFKDVGWMCIPTDIADVRIQEATSDEAESVLANTGTVRRDGRKMFVVSGAQCRGYVLAGIVVWKEDVGEYSDPSSLLE